MKCLVEYKSLLGFSIREVGTLSPCVHLSGVYLLHHSLPKPLKLSVYCLSMGFLPIYVRSDAWGLGRLARFRELPDVHPGAFLWERRERTLMLVLDLDLLGIPFQWEYEVKHCPMVGTRIYCRFSLQLPEGKKSARTLLRDGEAFLQRAEQRYKSAAGQLKAGLPFIPDLSGERFDEKEMDRLYEKLKDACREYWKAYRLEMQYDVEDYIKEMSKQEEMVIDAGHA